MKVTNRSAETAQRKAAVIGGLAILLMVIPPILSGLVIDRVLVPGDAAATANNILAGELQFRLAILGLLLVIVLDVIASWGLYVFFKPVNSSVSLLAAWFRLVYTAVFTAAILNLGQALTFLLGSGTLAEVERSAMQALNALQAFDGGWDLALLLFGFHLLLLGYLAFEAGYVPKLIGALLIIAGLGYVFDSVAGLLFPDLGFSISMITFVGELLLALWLVYKGMSVKRWESVALQAT
jgi:hypothetical protein